MSTPPADSRPVPVLPFGGAVEVSGWPSVPYPDGYLLESLRCLTCGRWMSPTPVLDGTRAYSCGPPCPQPDLAAGPVESELLLRASLRAVVTLHPDLARVTYVNASLVDLADWDGGRQPDPDRDQVGRWEQVDLGDHRAMLRAAFVRVDVDAEGQIHPVWRHRTRPAGAGS